jgi:hypothetical protein
MAGKGGLVKAEVVREFLPRKGTKIIQKDREFFNHGWINTDGRGRNFVNGEHEGFTLAGAGYFFTRMKTDGHGWGMKI